MHGGSCGRLNTWDHCASDLTGFQDPRMTVDKLPVSERTHSRRIGEQSRRRRHRIDSDIRMEGSTGPKRNLKSDFGAR